MLGSTVIHRLCLAMIVAAACAPSTPRPPSHAVSGPAEPAEETLSHGSTGWLAADDTDVYWTVPHADGDTVWRLARRPGAKPVKLATTAPKSELVTLDRDAVWWFAAGRAHAVSKVGGEVRTLPMKPLGDVWSLARHRDDVVLGVSDPDTMRSTIVRLAATDGAPRGETKLDGQAPRVISGSDGLYAGTDAVLVRIGDDGRVHTLSARSEEMPIEVKAIALDRDTVYFSSYCEVRRVPRAGGRTTSLGCKSGDVQSVAVDDTYVYWGVEWNESPGSAIYRVPKRGGEIELVTLVEYSPGALAIDPTHVYWANVAAGHVKRLRR